MGDDQDLIIVDGLMRLAPMVMARRSQRRRAVAKGAVNKNDVHFSAPIRKIVYWPSSVGMTFLDFAFEP